MSGRMGNEFGGGLAHWNEIDALKARVLALEVHLGLVAPPPQPSAEDLSRLAQLKADIADLQEKGLLPR